MKNFIEENILNSSGKVNSQRIKRSWFIANEFGEEYDDIIKETHFLDVLNPKMGQRLWHILNKKYQLITCLECNNNVKFQNLISGYNLFCSRECQNKSNHVKQKREATVFKKYGVNNVFKSEEVKDKIVCSNLANHGVRYPMQSENIRVKSRNTSLERYGVDNYSKSEYFKQSKREWWSELDVTELLELDLKRNIGISQRTSEDKINISNKRKNTLLERYGVDNVRKIKGVNAKIKDTCKKKYGVSNPFQSLELMNNVTYQRKDYTLPSGSIVRVQGYEPAALDILLKEYTEQDLLIDDIDIANEIGIIKYCKNRRYIPDIYIIPLNKIIEVKSWYTLQVTYENTLDKRAACLERGFSFSVWVIDNNKIELEI